MLADAPRSAEAKNVRKSMSDISPWLLEKVAPGQFQQLALGYPMGQMRSIREIRHHQLMVLITQMGSIQAVADQLGKSHSQISQLRNQLAHSTSGKPRGIGDDLAREIEKKFDRPYGWMDQLAEPEDSNVESAGRPSVVRRVPVVGEAKMGPDGHYDEAQYPPGGDGTVDGYSSDPDAYALRVRGDSMHPAIRHGSFVVVEPHGRCVTGEYVALQLVDGRKMVKELIIERPTEIVVESVNGNSRQTIERSLIERMHPVAAVVSPSKWRPA